MTLKQGKSINTKFTQLNSEITDLNNEVRKSKVELRYLENTITRLNRDFQFTSDSIQMITKERNYYKSKYEGVKNLEFADKKARVHMRIGIVVLAASWITFILTAVK